MAYFVISCKQLINVDTNEDLVEVKYNKYIEGFGYETFKDYFNTELSGSFDILEVSSLRKVFRYYG